MGNASDTPILRSGRATFGVVVGHIVPSLGVDMRNQSSLVVINAESDNLYIRPVAIRSVFFYHFTVVGHWRLAGWTPCGPEVKQIDVASFMSQIRKTTYEVCKSFDLWHILANCISIVFRD